MTDAITLTDRTLRVRGNLNGKLLLYDVLGRQRIFSEAIAKEAEFSEFDLSVLAPGVYFITTEGNTPLHAKINIR